MNFKETILLLVFGSASTAYLLFNYSGGLLGPYGGQADIYHEVILAGLLFMGAIFIYIASKVSEDE